MRLLILGAHPDDAEYHAGGLAARWRARGDTVKMVSLTDGSAGHHARQPAELKAIRRAEAAAAGKVIGAEYVTWDTPDGTLLPTLEVRGQIIREIRTFQPDLVLAHRPNDYHPDHRAVGQAVQDACYLLTVPRIEPSVPALRRDPVVASMVDLFTRPIALQPDAILDATPELETILDMMSCHVSQFFEWLPYNEGIDHTVPAGVAERRTWLREWFLGKTAPRRARFAPLLERAGRKLGPRDGLVLEAYEISEYAGKADPALLQRLFPGATFGMR
jgi:LmbE family N-acetylglucosaminyl deacetylase